MLDGARAAGMEPERLASFPTAEEAAGAITSLVREDDLVLVKGSRGIHMERIAERLLADLKET
jgi:UDP-N-acetylmuramoyl-tripeptide--D-alanyl-D-alanine ligase